MIPVSDPATSSPTYAAIAVIAAVFLYRAAISALDAAFRATPSIQRRRLLEEEAIPNAGLARELARPHTLGMGITLCSQILLIFLLAMVWPLGLHLPGGFPLMALLTLAYAWAMDLALPTLLTAHSPILWMQRLYPLYAPAHLLLRPLLAPLAQFAARQRELHDKDPKDEDEDHDDAVTALLEEGQEEGILREHDRELIRNVVTFGDTIVREVMTPRTSIRSVPVTATAEELWAAFRDSRHSRLPVYEGSVDVIVGIVLLKDLLQVPPGESLDLWTMLKPAGFVPESKPILGLLREFQTNRTLLAVVVDEFGTVSGIVTIEDLLEEVFGEILDEHEAHSDIEALSDKEFLVAGQVHIETLAGRLHLPWEPEGFDTLAGFVMARLGHIPSPQEVLEVEGARLKVTHMEGPRILQVQITLSETPPQPE